MMLFLLVFLAEFVHFTVILYVYVCVVFFCLLYLFFAAAYLC